MRISVFLIICMLFSCKQKQAATCKVNFEILNKELYYNGKYINNSSLNLNYKNNADRNNAFNIVTWKLTNFSDKNILLILGEDDFLQNPFSNYSNYKIDIKNKDGILRKGGSSNILWADTPGTGSLLYYREYKEYNDSIKRHEYQLKGVSLDKVTLQEIYTKKSFILHPNESRTFQSILSLPILKEADNKTLSGELAVDGLEDGDELRFVYESDSTSIKEHLLDYQLQELKDNKVSIFHGKLISNPVPLKSR